MCLRPGYGCVLGVCTFTIKQLAMASTHTHMHARDKTVCVNVLARRCHGYSASDAR